MKSKRFLCLLLVLLMVFSLTPSETRAETTVYFTAVNDQLLPDLSGECRSPHRRRECPPACFFSVPPESPAQDCSFPTHTADRSF